MIYNNKTAYFFSVNYSTECFIDLDKLTMIAYGGLVLDSSQFSELPQKQCSVLKWSKLTRKQSYRFDRLWHTQGFFGLGNVKHWAQKQKES